MNEIAKHKAAIEDADTQNKVFKSREFVCLPKIKLLFQNFTHKTNVTDIQIYSEIYVH